MHLLCDFAMLLMHLKFLYFIFSHYLKCPINSGKIYKKSAQKNLWESPKWDQRGATRGPAALVAHPRGRPRRGATWTPWSTPLGAPFAYIYPSLRKPSG